MAPGRNEQEFYGRLMVYPYFICTINAAVGLVQALLYKTVTDEFAKLEDAIPCWQIRI